MLRQLIFWFHRWKYSEIHPEELFEILVSIKKTYTKNAFGMPPTWEHRKYKIAGEYALSKPIEDIAKQYNITRTRVHSIAWRIYHDYNKGLYENE